MCGPGSNPISYYTVGAGGGEEVERILALRGGCMLEKRGVTFFKGVAILQNKMKSEIFNDKKS